MIEIENAKQGKKNVKYDPTGKVGVQITSPASAYICVHNALNMSLLDYQNFYTDAFSSLALRSAKKQHLKQRVEALDSDKAQDEMWMVQHFVEEHGTYVQILSNQTGINEAPLQWNQLIEFIHLKNMMEMIFSSMQLNVPKKDEIMKNVKYNICVKPGHVKLLIIRQIRAE